MKCFLSLLLIVLASMTACAPRYRSFYHREGEAQQVEREPQTVRNNFLYQSLPGSVQRFELAWEESVDYKVFLIEVSWTVPGKKEIETMEFTYAKSKFPGKKKTVIVLPIYSKKQLHELLPLFLASSLSHWNQSADFNVIFIKEKTDHDPFDLDSLAKIGSEEQAIAWMKESARRFRRAVTGLRAVLDWAEQEEAVDAKRIGIIGFSTSASIAVVAAGVDPRISVTVFFVGGTNFPKIFTKATEPRIKKFRKMLRAKKVPWDAFLQTAASIFGPIDPIRYVGNLTPAKTLYFDAEFDEYVPQKNREEFWHTAGRPQRIMFRSGHRDSFLALTPLGLFSAHQIIKEFLREKL